MQLDSLRDVARDFLTLSAAHHLALCTILIMFWVRRKNMERVIAGYFAAAFGTATAALATRAASRGWAVVAACLVALWVAETVRPKTVLSFLRTPRTRLIVMGAAGLFAIAYPGYSDGLPPLVFAPVGVILAPTLLAALAILNCAAPTTARPLHGSLAAAGFLVGATSAAADGWAVLPLLVTSAYAVLLLLGRARTVERPAVPENASVESMRARMYSRRTLLPGPRDPRRASWRGRRRRW